MKLASMVIAAVCCAAVGGCALKGPELRVGPPVQVNVENDNGGGGKFCPPGQAKKGRC